jgi:hypothetical protein
MSKDVKVSHDAECNRPWGSHGAISHTRGCSCFGGSVSGTASSSATLSTRSWRRCGSWRFRREGSLPLPGRTTSPGGSASQPVPVGCGTYISTPPNRSPVDALRTRGGRSRTCDFKVRFQQTWEHCSYSESRTRACRSHERRRRLLLSDHAKEAANLQTRRTIHCMEYTMPNVPRREHSSRFVQPWVLPLSITRHANEGTYVSLIASMNAA